MICGHFTEKQFSRNSNLNIHSIKSREEVEQMQVAKAEPAYPALSVRKPA